VSTTVAVVRFPGVNCEAETARALERAGLTAEIVTWSRPPSELRAFAAYVLPGGFSYQDRVRAGALAAKHPIVEVLAAEAERGKPLLGICNGAQILIEAGLVPDGGNVDLALARNSMPARQGYHARWVHVRVEESPCVFTRSLEPGTVLPLPVAHAEGRVIGEPGLVEALIRSGQAPLRYALANGDDARAFPENPNGSELAVAAVCNRRGNIMAVMPHPERAQDLGALPVSLAGPWASTRDALRESGDHEALRLADGPGLELFKGLATYLEGA